jgi:hypothetical protein
MPRTLHSFSKLKIILLSAALIAVIQLHASAEDAAKTVTQQIAPEDKVISSTIKTLAKVYVASRDISSLAASVEDMSDDVYSRQISRFNRILSLCPQLGVSFGITTDMPRDLLVEKIKRWDKQKMYSLIDSIPDSVIASEVKGYLSRRQKPGDNSNLVLQITKAWNTVLGHAGAQ